MTAIRKYWFLIGLVVCIAAGIALGNQQGPGSDEPIVPLDTRLATAIVLFLMSFTLKGDHLRDAFLRPWPVAIAFAINFGLIPLMAIPAMGVQFLSDFEVGLMIAASVPCTMAAASVWTRKAGGNDAVSLLVTVTTNGSCFLITPLWLNWRLESAVELDLSSMITRLLTGVLIPMLIGQLLRLWPPCAAWADRFKTECGVVAQALILALVFTGATNAGMRIAGGGTPPGVGAIALVWFTVIVLHLLAFTVGLASGRALGFAPRDVTAMAFASSQKTLPIGLLLADMVSTAAPFAVFPMLMFHASQLFIDTALVPRLARWNES